jgi:hypothetical protein
VNIDSEEEKEELSSVGGGSVRGVKYKWGEQYSCSSDGELDDSEDQLLGKEGGWFWSSGRDIFGEGGPLPFG